MKTNFVIILVSICLYSGNTNTAQIRTDSTPAEVIERLTKIAKERDSVERMKQDSAFMKVDKLRDLSKKFDKVSTINSKTRETLDDANRKVDSLSVANQVTKAKSEAQPAPVIQTTEKDTEVVTPKEKPRKRGFFKRLNPFKR